MLYDITINGRNYRLELTQREGRWLCRLDSREIELDAVLVRPDVLSLRIADKAYEVRRVHAGNETQIWVGSEQFAAELRDPRSLRGRARTSDNRGPQKLSAPMPGKVVRVLVAAGDSVEAGTGVVVVEA